MSQNKHFRLYNYSLLLAINKQSLLLKMYRVKLRKSLYLFLDQSFIIFSYTCIINLIIYLLIRFIIMSRILGISPTMHPDRLNPEFIGIGSQYSQHKRDRLQSDKFRQTVTSNFEFTVKLNKELEKNLEEKEKQLLKLQAIRERHHEDIRNKLEREHQRQRELYNLRKRSQQQRNNMEEGIKFAKDSLQNDRFINKMAIKEEMNEKKIKWKAQNQQYYNQKCLKHRSVQLGKKFGNERINKFYRQKNLQSYNDYIKRIKQQNDKSNDNMNQIKRMNKNMYSLERKIHKNQMKLKDILEEMSMYSFEGQNDRKANLLATASAFRSISTNSSRRENPRDLLKGTFYKTDDLQFTI